MDKLLKLFGLGGNNIIESIGKVADTFITTPGEKQKFLEEATKEVNRHIEAMEANATDIYKTEVEDRKNARQMASDLNNSTNASWLSKNVAPLIGIFIVFSTILIWALILFRNYEPKTNEAMIIGALTTICSGVISYYFGSSSSSSAKDKSISNLINNQK